MPVQAEFILRRLAEMADRDPELRARQPGRPRIRTTTPGGKVLAEHYAGDDTNLPALAAGILAAVELRCDCEKSKRGLLRVLPELGDLRAQRPRDR